MKASVVNRAVGVWYGLHDSEVHSANEVGSVFEDLSKEQVEKVVAAHDKFRETLYKILTDSKEVPS